ncbi:transcriptional regulator, Crp/Fnr family [hydrothermal vent metagenome]|uniref:Transcriptional regulator, Crp/Fnr family n=1 Tax=hydrothermal vent metagenome TaxID=652676 RepID=A0A3B0XPX5_9ZZZZ
MQFFNSRKSSSATPESGRFQKIKAAYPELGEINDMGWKNTITHARMFEAPPETTLFNGNTACNNFMLILDGIIRVYQTAEDGREKTLYRVEAGNLCILSLNSLLKSKTFNAIAVTESSLKTLIISPEDFKRSMNELETFRDFILGTLTDRLCETIYIIQETAFNHLNMRLACLLGGLFERNKSPLLKITHQEIAHELGTTREVISRILKEFEKQNCVKLSRGHIELSSAKGLQWFSEPR